MEPSKEPSLTGQGMIQESVEVLHEQEALTYGAREANRQTSGGIALAILVISASATVNLVVCVVAIAIPDHVGTGTGLDPDVGLVSDLWSIGTGGGIRMVTGLMASRGHSGSRWGIRVVGDWSRWTWRVFPLSTRWWLPLVEHLELGCVREIQTHSRLPGGFYTIF